MVTYSVEGAGIPKGAISSDGKWSLSELPVNGGTGFLKDGLTDPAYTGITISDVADLSNQLSGKASLSADQIWTGVQTFNAGKLKATDITVGANTLTLPSGVTTTLESQNNKNVGGGYAGLNGTGFLDETKLRYTVAKTDVAKTWTAIQTFGAGMLKATDITTSAGTLNLPSYAGTTTLESQNNKGAANGYAGLNGTGFLDETKLRYTVVKSDQANTYTAGMKQTFRASSTSAGMNLPGVASNPSSLTSGDLWRNTSIDSLMLRGSSLSYTIVSNHTFAGNFFPTGTFTTNTAAGSGGTFYMAGMSASTNTGKIVFTPTSTGRALVIVSFGLAGSNNNNACQVKLAYGDGTSGPNVLAGATGTVVSPAYVEYTPSTTKTQGPFDMSAEITGLTTGTSYWVDAQILSPSNTNTCTYSTVEGTVIEN